MSKSCFDFFVIITAGIGPTGEKNVLGYAKFPREPFELNEETPKGISLHFTPHLRLVTVTEVVGLRKRGRGPGDDAAHKPKRAKNGGAEKLAVTPRTDDVLRPSRTCHKTKWALAAAAAFVSGAYCYFK